MLHLFWHSGIPEPYSDFYGLLRVFVGMSFSPIGIMIILGISIGNVLYSAFESAVGDKVKEIFNKILGKSNKKTTEEAKSPENVVNEED